MDEVDPKLTVPLEDDPDIAVHMAVLAEKEKPPRKLKEPSKKRAVSRSRPALTFEQVLAWADVHFEHTGIYPTEFSGRIDGTQDETWRTVASAMHCGSRGFPPRSSLFKLLAENRGVTRIRAIPHLSIDTILTWADAHRHHFGRWPTNEDGPVSEAPNETWKAINQDLICGYRGLPGGRSLSQLLATHRRQFVIERSKNLTETTILYWADEHFERTGKWPKRFSGSITEAKDTSWQAVDDSLKEGRRGLSGGSTLARLLAEKRGIVSPKHQPDLTEERIIDWAVLHHSRTGKWPSANSGTIDGAYGETWRSVCNALQRGRRGLARGKSLHRLLAAHGHFTEYAHQPLTEHQILGWADEVRTRSGLWPAIDSGQTPADYECTWAAVNSALRYGYRGLPGGTSLARFLSRNIPLYAAERNRLLTLELILSWADVHIEEIGCWPDRQSGPIPGDPSTTWATVDDCLKEGRRGLTKGGSLAKLLAEHRTRYSVRHRPDLTVQQVLDWAISHHARTGTFPPADNTPVPESPGDTWGAIRSALREGRRGLPSGTSLARLFASRDDLKRRSD